MSANDRTDQKRCCQSEVGVVLLNWNGGEFTIPCIQSLLESEYKPSCVLVFDNGSTDDSPDLIERRFPEVLVIRNGVNIGFTGGNNEGIRVLINKGVDLIWILNNDTVVASDCLKHMVEAMANDPSIAAATGKILYENPRDRIWYAGADFNPWTMAAAHKGILELDDGRYNAPADVSFISGCSLLVRAGILQKLGAFKESFFIYYEDADWCLRAVKNGCRMRYIPEAILWHKVSSSMTKNTIGSSRGTMSCLSHYLCNRNYIYTIREHASRPWQFVSAMSFALGRGMFYFLALAGLMRVDKALSVLKGLFHGIINPLPE